MENNVKFKSQENLERLETLTALSGFSSIRLMIDPQKASSTEAVIEDICLNLEEETSGNKNSPMLFSFSM